MKNNKILYILTLIITLFSFNTNVYAKTTTCKYVREIEMTGLPGVKKEHIIETKCSINASGTVRTFEITENDPEKGQHSGKNESTNYYKYSFEHHNVERSSCSCLDSLWVTRYVDIAVGKTTIETKVYGNEETGSDEYKKVSEDTKNGSVQELTCLYEKGQEKEKVLLIQTSTGQIKLYTNKQDAEIGSAGWIYNYNDINKKNYKIEISDKIKNSQNNLESCPLYAELDYLNGNIKLYNDAKFFTNEQALEEKLDYVKEPTAEIVTPPSNGEGNFLEGLDRNKYQASCECKDTISTDANSKYHIIYLAYGVDRDNNNEPQIKYSEYDPEKGDYSSIDDTGYADPTTANLLHHFTFNVSPNFTAKYFIDKYGGGCPHVIVADRNKGSNSIITGYVGNTPLTQRTDYIYTTLYTDEESSKGTMYLCKAYGTNPITGEGLVGGVPNINIEFEKIDVKNCKDLFGDNAEEITGYFNMAWNIVKFGIPIVLLAMGTIDFAQAVFASKEEGMKKAQEKFIKRIIIAVAIFLVPTLISFLLGIANGIWGNIGTDLCGLIF